MARLIRLFRTSIGRKLVVALTGVLLLGFLLAHMAGNLVILQGPDALNAYAAWMQGHPLLWGLRLALLVIVAVHIVAAVGLARENRASRPVRYRHRPVLASFLPGRFMVVSGLLVLAFLVFHLLHLTARVVMPELGAMTDADGRVDVYRGVVLSFSDPLVAGFYLAALLLLGLHLLHAVESLFQTFGFNHESYQTLIRVLAPTLTLLIVAGFATVPLLVLAGMLPHGGAS
jgi:succinate dehydrogenase / fumarate reductase cytochrome b subunit